MTHAPATDAQSNHHPSADDAQIRLAAVSYLNTTPLIEGLAKLERVRLTLSAPAQLIALLDQDHADLALASVIDAAHQPDAYSIIPAGIIGCDGPTLTVRVFSKAPIEDATTLHADIDSHTSVALARIVLHHLTGRDPEVHPFDADQWAAKRTDAPDTPWPDTLLLIGDKVVTDSPPAAVYPHQLDLGQAWHDITGLPFVYAAWLAKRQRENHHTTRVAAALLDRQLRHNRTRLAWIAERRAKQAGWPVDVARQYLGELLRYDLTPRHAEGLSRFFSMAAHLGIIPHPTTPPIATHHANA